MTLTPSDMVELARLAFMLAPRGKQQAKAAFTQHAAVKGWGNTPAWIEGRTIYTAAWKRHRAAHLAALAPAPPSTATATPARPMMEKTHHA